MKNALITGGTSGIGLSIVKALAKNNYQVYFIGSNHLKGKEIELELRNSSNNKAIHFVNLDLSNLKEVQEFVQRFKKKHAKLDLLANIAGVLLPKRQETIDGLEKTFVVSFLSGFYLTNELIPLLKESENGKIINVAAKPSLILNQKLDFNDLSLEKDYNGFRASTLAVHAKTVLTSILSQKLNGNSIIVNSFDPGYVKSNLSRSMSGFQKQMMRLANLFFSKESKTGIEACLAQDLNNVSGKLLVGKKVLELNFDKDYCESLWNKSTELLERTL